jgi:hypothetical protein
MPTINDLAFSQPTPPNVDMSQQTQTCPTCGQPIANTGKRGPGVNLTPLNPGFTKPKYGLSPINQDQHKYFEPWMAPPYNGNYQAYMADKQKEGGMGNPGFTKPNLGTDRNPQLEQQYLNKYMQAQGRLPSTIDEWKTVQTAAYGNNIPSVVKNLLEPPY